MHARSNGWPCEVKSLQLYRKILTLMLVLIKVTQLQMGLHIRQVVIRLCLIVVHVSHYTVLDQFTCENQHLQCIEPWANQISSNLSWTSPSDESRLSWTELWEMKERALKHSTSSYKEGRKRLLRRGIKENKGTIKTRAEMCGAWREIKPNNHRRGNKRFKTSGLKYSDDK